MGRLDNKRVLVAGGTGRVGQYLTRAQLKAGATVIVPSRSRKKLDALEASVGANERARLRTIVADISAHDDAVRILDLAGPLDGAVASLGEFVMTPSILGATDADFQRVYESYVLAHFSAARLFLPALRQEAGAYVMINGPLAFSASMPGAGLVSIATAAQAMLARVLRADEANAAVRIEELVIYSSFGWGHDDENPVTGADIGRFVAHLIARQRGGCRGETIHLRTREGIPADD